MERRKLDNWKQIAAFLGCSERTAKRYQLKGLPVHYVAGHQLQRVYAYTDEITAWIGFEQRNHAMLPVMDGDQEKEVLPDPALAPYCLVGIGGKPKGRIIPLEHAATRVGRESDNHIVLTETDVSRHHALLLFEGGRFQVRDLKSKNGTFVNSRRMEEMKISVGDRVRFGDAAEFLLQDIHSTETC